MYGSMRMHCRLRMINVACTAREMMIAKGSPSDNILPEKVVVVVGQGNSFDNIICCHLCGALPQSCLSAFLLLLLLLLCSNCSRAHNGMGCAMCLVEGSVYQPFHGRLPAHPAGSRRRVVALLLHSLASTGSQSANLIVSHYVHCHQLENICL